MKALGFRVGAWLGLRFLFLTRFSAPVRVYNQLWLGYSGGPSSAEWLGGWLSVLGVGQFCVGFFSLHGVSRVLAFAAGWVVWVDVWQAPCFGSAIGLSVWGTRLLLLTFFPLLCCLG
ncbi:hypothetical protein OIU84_017547 [Salix udensis]|uniref:Uncharacterized protein n=1 Tax=Salix udensis TaxID=889485 RepID=A0AAD6L3S6_9ROSI|nr:hypothetical protein OIU84_017547 [Salix udensis]